jgi:hypothetical protein
MNEGGKKSREGCGRGGRRGETYIAEDQNE